ncbi:histone-lysine N-methyltransferase SUVR5-like isoform X2 [Durio zibethinus]|uniref:Histone-lysine N-methyltransferase SUVR5-like isoform X2 n=1 Tax=Durio zibethinus TaxID=66656 RepID=A0A6P5ZG82_DURZI|nr:histone-lysine N-methyltransferase SUVR5-like isoform X2 [Durio zibethinus]
MEVLPYSGVQYVADSDCAQPSSGTTFTYDGESNCLEHRKQVQVTDGRMNDLLLSMEGIQAGRQDDGQGTRDELPISEEHHSGSSYYDCQAEGLRLSCGSHDYEDDDSNAQNYCTGPHLACENSHLIVDTIESESPSSKREGELSLSEPNWLERDVSVALWVKWRGKWQAGIRCARADWPLSTLKAKPTHDRKQYFVIFFPHTRNYSWADIQLVQSINEFPQPIAYRSHKVGLKMVRDLSVARRYIMQKLAVSMLNIIDQFHCEALIETARNVIVWKEFAMEASRCSRYSDIGKMLLKLQSRILPHYVNANWLQESFHSWVQQCQNSHSAESIELLKEELFDTILWNEVRSLGDAPVQPTLGSEWKTWKHEVMKWFSTSHPVSTAGDVDHWNGDGPSNISTQVSKKRPKLEVRRAETHASQVQSNGSDQTITVEIDSDFFSRQDAVDVNMPIPEICKNEDEREETTPMDTSNNLTDRWDKIVVEARHSELIDFKGKDVEIAPASEEVKSTSTLHIQPKEVELTPVNEAVAKKSTDAGSKTRQCIAFIESKGRQCVRWANDGDVYCCVHLASRFIGSSGKTEVTSPVGTLMCEATTVLGTRCKHRSLCGSSFCKKHRPKNDENNISHSPEHAKRKHVEIIPSSETTHCRDVVLAGDSESPLQVEPMSITEGDVLHGRNHLIEKPGHSVKDHDSTELLHCIGLFSHSGFDPCNESPKRHSLYCDKHLPSWLKRARNGKSRIVSKEVFIDLLKDCYSLEQKLHLHQACELFYKLFKSILSLRNPVPMEVQLQWALSEASKNFRVGEILMKLVYSEKERIQRLWGFTGAEGAPLSSFVEEPVPLPLAVHDSFDDDKTIKCKICSVEFLDDQHLGTHWMENHKKEAQWLFRGYACAICLDSFTSKKVLESHVQERHRVQFVEHCMLLRCIPCGNHFGNTEELWLHVLSTHPVDFRLSKIAQHHNLSMREESPLKLELGNSASLETNSENVCSFRKFICRFCGLKFDLLPDLGRHHQAAHMGPSLASSRPPKRGVRFYAYKLKSGRLSHPRFKKGLEAVSYRIRNRATATMKKRLLASKSIGTDIISVEPHVTGTSNLGRLAELQCSSLAEKLFSKVHKTKPRPNNLDILSIACSSCCQVSLKASLEEKYGMLPERMYLKAAKLCSEHNIQVEWHQEEFVCVNGCKPVKDPDFLSPLISFPNDFGGHPSADSLDNVDKELELDECHYIIDSQHFKQWSMQKASVLCDDLSFGKESVPVACVVDEGLSDSLYIYGDSSNDQNARSSMPWENFTYVTKSLLDQSLDLDAESLQLGCTCSNSSCSPETCDHVYLFDSDYEDARDIYGKPMRGRFPYDDKGLIILEEGYLVYECNHMCSCNRACPNRVLQNGVRVKLEVFKTENKGWGVRAGEPILSGTFVCECIGEILDEQEANNRLTRYDRDGCNYMYNVDSHINDMSRLIEGQVRYVIDATKYGNVSRFINHSCSANLVNHQVLVDSMDCHRAHIGLYASQDIAMGEELTFDYQYKLLPGQGYPCLCGASACRGRLY